MNVEGNKKILLGVVVVVLLGVALYMNREALFGGSGYQPGPPTEQPAAAPVEDEGAPKKKKKDEGADATPAPDAPADAATATADGTKKAPVRPKARGKTGEKKIVPFG